MHLLNLSEIKLDEGQMTAESFCADLVECGVRKRNVAWASHLVVKNSQPSVEYLCVIPASGSCLHLSAEADPGKQQRYSCNWSWESWAELLAPGFDTCCVPLGECASE